jgi:hypothetical protein
MSDPELMESDEDLLTEDDDDDHAVVSSMSNKGGGTDDDDDDDAKNGSDSNPNNNARPIPSQHQRGQAVFVSERIVVVSQFLKTAKRRSCWNSRVLF